jgi:hypothetical protein
MSIHDGELGILARRRIEAEIIKPIYEILVRDYGKEKAAAVIGEAVSHAAVEAGRGFAAREANGPSLEGFVALQELWEKDDALKVEIIASDATHYDYDVKRCRYAEMYHEMGLGEIGHLLSCNRDELFIVGYDPRVGLSRTQTIMGGASHCNFRYTVKDQEQQP